LLQAAPSPARVGGPMLKTLVVVGTRPEVIKMAPVVRALTARPKIFRLRLCSTGQHRDMLDQALRAMELRADIDLDLMRPGQSLSELAASVLLRLPETLRAEAPDVVSSPPSRPFTRGSPWPTSRRGFAPETGPGRFPRRRTAP
jgi:hypothetical protein